MHMEREPLKSDYTHASAGGFYAATKGTLYTGTTSQASDRQYDTYNCNRYGAIARHIPASTARETPHKLLNGQASADPLCCWGISGCAIPERRNARLCKTSLRSTATLASHAPRIFQNINEAGHADMSKGRGMGAGSPAQALIGAHAVSASRSPVAPMGTPPHSVKEQMRVLLLNSVSRKMATISRSMN